MTIHTTAENTAAISRYTRVMERKRPPLPFNGFLSSLPSAFSNVHTAGSMTAANIIPRTTGTAAPHSLCHSDNSSSGRSSRHRARNSSRQGKKYFFIFCFKEISFHRMYYHNYYIFPYAAL